MRLARAVRSIRRGRNCVQALGIVPDEPVPYFGWGDIPYQYRRRWDGDGGV